MRIPVAALALVLLIPASARADALQDQLLAGIRAARPDAYAFRRTTVAARTGADRRIYVESFDPRRSDRWTLVSVDGRAPTAKEAAQSRKAARGPVPSYAELGKWFGSPATRVASAPGTATYRFARLPAGTMTINKRDASADTVAEAVVDLSGKVPYVETVRLTLTRGFRMALVAKVDSIATVARYRLLADGHPVPADTDSRIAGSLLGKSGQLRVTMAYSDFAPR